MKDLSKIWIIGSNYAILSLPIITYSVQPHWRNKIRANEVEHRFTASFKSTVEIFQSFECEYKTMEEAKKGCEHHLQKLMDYLFLKLENVVEFRLAE
ncbi:MAG: hypothetical protein LCH67_20295 [Bacteroidetes bacterium]|nr:hypothetical protein [Bacteroidota bacterium]